MIEALLGFLSGGGVRLAQSWFGLKEKALEQEHEFRMLDLNIKLDAQRAAAELDKAKVDATSTETVAEINALVAGIEAAAKPSGIRWIDGLNALVRPVAYYWHCVVVYSVYKGFVLVRLVQLEATLDE